MTEEHIKEELSLAYIRAVTASAGFTCETRNKDYGIDGSINDVHYNPVRKSFRESGIAIDFQAKSTINVIVKEDQLIYDLRAENYLDLIDTNVARQRILILYILPEESTEWLSVTSDMTILKKCAYWCSLRGQPEKNNKVSVRINIPKNQILTSEALKQMMEIVKGGGFL